MSTNCIVGIVGTTLSRTVQDDKMVENPDKEIFYQGAIEARNRNIEYHQRRERMKDLEQLEAKIGAQKQYCKDHKVPLFAPSNGRCWNCGKIIYDRISLETAATTHITGCPYCHRSYCD